MSMRNIQEGLCARCYKPAPNKCPKCAARSYCSKYCQTKDWELGHKFMCGKDPQPPCTERPVRPCSLVFPAEELPELMIAPRLEKPMGHHNLGNTCYINSVLQCLCAVPALRTALGSRNHRSQCEKDHATDYCAACEMEEHFETIQEAQEASKPGEAPFVVQPRPIAGHVSYLNQDFRIGQQEDAHEFLHALLQKAAEASVPASWSGRREVDKDTTSIHQLMHGVTASQVFCPK